MYVLLQWQNGNLGLQPSEKHYLFPWMSRKYVNNLFVHLLSIPIKEKNMEIFKEELDYTGNAGTLGIEFDATRLYLCLGA